MVEKQDLPEKWKKYQSTFFEREGHKYQDFAKRVCAIRELFEETNLLFTNESNNDIHMDVYNKHYEANFINFCQGNLITPALSRLYGFQRIGSPIGLYPAVDSQFYLCFCDSDTF